MFLVFSTFMVCGVLLILAKVAMDIFPMLDFTNPMTIGTFMFLFGAFGLMIYGACTVPDPIYSLYRRSKK